MHDWVIYYGSMGKFNASQLQLFVSSKDITSEERDELINLMLSK